MSGIVIITDLRSYIKNETLRGKNPTEILSALSEVCGEFTVDCGTVSRWVNRFRGGSVSTDNDPIPGRPRTSTDERSVKLVADALEEDRRATCEELSRTTGEKLCGKMHKNRSQLLVIGPLILHDNARPHMEDVVTKTSRLWVGSVASCALQCRHESSRLRLISKIKRTYAWTAFFFCGRTFYLRYPSYQTHE